jgi:hypothetical protein
MAEVYCLYDPAATEPRSRSSSGEHPELQSKVGIRSANNAVPDGFEKGQVTGFRVTSEADTRRLLRSETA